jgi:hypothetical protein
VPGKNIGYGTTVKVSTDTTSTSSTGATAVGNLISWGGSGAPVPKVDTTDIDDSAETCEPGTPGADEAGFVVGYKQGSAGVRKLLAMHKNRTKGKLWLRPMGSTGNVDECVKGFISNAGIESFDRTGRINRAFAIQPTSAVGLSTA